MKANKIIALSASLLLLAGCGTVNTSVTDPSEKLFSIGDKTFTKNDEYELLKMSNGPTLTMQGVQKLIYDAEVGSNDDIQKEAEKMYDEYSQYSDSFDEQILSYGYKDKQDYIDTVLIPSVQADKLLEKYITEDGKNDVQATYKPVLAAVIECDSEDNAAKAKEALEKGDDPAAVGEQYAYEDSEFKGQEQIISTLSKELPTRLINSLFETEKDGVIDEIFTNDTSTDEKRYYVADLISNDFDANKDKIYEALKSDTDLNSQCMIYYLKKYDFEVHDQYIFDYFKANNPEYLVTRPDLSEDK